MRNEYFTGYNRKMRERTRELRKNMTPQEKHLWYDYLSSYDIKIYRQRSIGGFMVDFYCSKAKLAIEIDGSQHYTEEGIEYDKERSFVLKKYGIETIRFSNLDIDKNFEGVCQEIDITVKERI